MQEAADEHRAWVERHVRPMCAQMYAHPERIGEELRRRHRDTAELSQRHFYLVALDALIEAAAAQQDSEPEKRWDGLFDGGVPQALLDIALDRQVYAHMYADDDATAYVLDTYTCLSKLVCHAVKFPCGRAHAAGKQSTWATDIVQKFPKLWPLLLQLSDSVTHGCNDLGGITLGATTEEAKQSKRFRMLIYELICSHKALCDAETGQPPSPRGDIGLVALLVSTCGSYTPDLRGFFTSMLFETICMPSDELAPFLDRALACHALIPTRFIYNMISCLLDEKVLDNELIAVLTALTLMFKHPVLVSARGTEKTFSLVLLSAAQRQVCSGIKAERTWEILLFTFQHIAYIMTQDPDGCIDIAHREYSHYLILLVARALCPAATDTTDRTDSLHKVMVMLTTSAQLIDDPALPPELNRAFRASVHQVWHRAHAGLAGLAPAAAPQKSKILKWWRDFGRQCGVDLDAPYVPPAPAPDDGPWTKDRGCAWRECMCFGERPHHRLRKCKRCEQVMYCSRKCQAQDWSDGGHKRMCRQLQA